MSVSNGIEPPEMYDSVKEARSIFEDLLHSPFLNLPNSITSCAAQVHIHGPPAGTLPTIPTLWREPEAITAIKALEATVALALVPLLHPEHANAIQNTDSAVPQASVDLDHATLDLFKSYLSTVNGHGKWSKSSLPYLKPTDIHRAQSNLYRRLSANMYETDTPGTFYHTHGSLEATPILNALGLPGFLAEEDVKQEDYDALCTLIGNEVRKHTVEQLEEMTIRTRQSGAPCMTEADFLATEHGKAVAAEPIVTIESIPTPLLPSTPDSPSTSTSASIDTSTITPSPTPPPLLSGLKVLDLTRVIAGPSITLTLAQYGATVLKITSPTLPDVPWYQVDLNFGKRTADLDLKSAPDRSTFESLLAETDILVDGYRPGALARLGYSPAQILSHPLRSPHNKLKGALIYVSESCFGGPAHAPLHGRPGWQPIADAISGLAWSHGVAIQPYLDDAPHRGAERAQPILPPFPMSDYGTGALGALGVLVALHRVVSAPGFSTPSASPPLASLHVSASLVRWNLFVQSLQPYPPPLLHTLLAAHAPEIRQFNLSHLSNFDVVSKAAIAGMRRLSPRLFDEKKKFLFAMPCPGFKGAVVRSLRPVVRYRGDVLRTGFEFERGDGEGDGVDRASRPNGFDEARWW